LRRALADSALVPERNSLHLPANAPAARTPPYAAAASDARNPSPLCSRRQRRARLPAGPRSAYATANSWSRSSKFLSGGAIHE
jgi:hypothetical protein